MCAANTQSLAGLAQGDQRSVRASLRAYLRRLLLVQVLGQHLAKAAGIPVRGRGGAASARGRKGAERQAGGGAQRGLPCVVAVQLLVPLSPGKGDVLEGRVEEGGGCRACCHESSSELPHFSAAGFRQCAARIVPRQAVRRTAARGGPLCL